MKTKNIIACAVALLMACSCEEQGEFQPVANYSEVTVKWNYNPYPDKVFSVDIDGQQITDSLMFKSENSAHTQATRLIVGDDGMKRLTVTDAEAGTVVLDTLVQVSGRITISLMAIGATDKPMIVGGGTVPADPIDRNFAKYSYIYVDPTLPDSVRVNFYLGNSSIMPEHDPAPFASTVLKRGEFSPYIEFTFNIYQYPVFYFELIDARTDEFIQAINPDTFAGFCYEVSAGNWRAPTDYKFSTVLLKYADPDEYDFFKMDRYHDLVLSQTPW